MQLQGTFIPPSGAKGDCTCCGHRGAVEQTRVGYHSHRPWHHYPGHYNSMIDCIKAFSSVQMWTAKWLKWTLTFILQDWLNAIPECSELVVSLISKHPQSCECSLSYINVIVKVNLFQIWFIKAWGPFQIEIKAFREELLQYTFSKSWHLVDLSQCTEGSPECQPNQKRVIIYPQVSTFYPKWIIRSPWVKIFPFS